MILYSPLTPYSFFFVLFSFLMGRPDAFPQRHPSGREPPWPRGAEHPPWQPRLCRTAHGGSLSSPGPCGSRHAAVWPHLSVTCALANSGAAFLNLTTNSRNLAAP